MIEITQKNKDTGSVISIDDKNAITIKEQNNIILAKGICFVDGKETPSDELNHISISNIQSIHILDSKSAVKNMEKEESRVR